MCVLASTRVVLDRFLPEKDLQCSYTTFVWFRRQSPCSGKSINATSVKVQKPNGLVKINDNVH